jgi:hypothetical protein
MMQLVEEINKNFSAVGICDTLSSELPLTRLTLIVPPLRTPGFILIPNCMLVNSKTVEPVLNK